MTVWGWAYRATVC